MSGFNFGFNDSSKDITSDTTKNETTAGVKTSQIASQGVQNQQQQQTTTLLGSDIQAALGGLVKQLIGSDATSSITKNADAINAAAKGMLDRANGAATDIMSTIQPIIAEAQRQAKLQIDTIQTNLARQAGGTTANSFVAGSTAEAAASLESQIAATTANMALQARTTQTDELNKAIQNMPLGANTQSTQSTAISQLVNVLRGATATTTATAQTTQSQTQSALETISQIVNTLAHTKSSEEDSGFSFGFG